MDNMATTYKAQKRIEENRRRISNYRKIRKLQIRQRGEGKMI
jgi:hypothetical protein